MHRSYVTKPYDLVDDIKGASIIVKLKAIRTFAGRCCAAAGCGSWLHGASWASCKVVSLLLQASRRAQGIRILRTPMFVQGECRNKTPHLKGNLLRKKP